MNRFTSFTVLLLVATSSATAWANQPQNASRGALQTGQDVVVDIGSAVLGAVFETSALGPSLEGLRVQLVRFDANINLPVVTQPDETRPFPSHWRLHESLLGGPDRPPVQRIEMLLRHSDGVYEGVPLLLKASGGSIAVELCRQSGDADPTADRPCGKIALTVGNQAAHSRPHELVELAAYRKYFDRTVIAAGIERYLAGRDGVRPEDRNVLERFPAASLLTSAVEALDLAKAYELVVDKGSIGVTAFNRAVDHPDGEAACTDDRRAGFTRPSECNDLVCDRPMCDADGDASPQCAAEKKWWPASPARPATCNEDITADDMRAICDSPAPYRPPICDLVDVGWADEGNFTACDLPRRPTACDHLGVLRLTANVAKGGTCPYGARSVRDDRCGSRMACPTAGSGGSDRCVPVGGYDEKKLIRPPPAPGAPDRASRYPMVPRGRSVSGPQPPNALNRLFALAARRMPEVMS